MSCETTWILEQKPGGSIIYDADVTYDAASFDGYTLYYNPLGEATTWFYEDPIDGCIAEEYEFQDGGAFTYMDGSTFEF